MKPIEITLGAHKYLVEEQPLAYLEMELGDVFAGLQGVNTPDDLAGMVPARRESRGGFDDVAGPGYSVLAVFIPKLMPEHEFRGYATADAFAAGVRDREAARLSPTVPQIVDAFDAVFRVNRLDVVKHLGKVVDPTLVQAFIKTAIGDSISELLLSSPSASGA